MGSSKSTQNREYHLKSQYNLSLEQVDEILISQDHKCAICRKSLDETKRCIDHDHETGLVRGILCIDCNFMIGRAHDNPAILRSAITYLLQADIENTEFREADIEYLQEHGLQTNRI